jgi:hypothetical protein
MSETTSAISEIVSMLRKDAKSPYPKYPSQSLAAIHDEGVVKSLERRFGQGARLRTIRALEYDFCTGLNRICFEFENAGPMLGGDDLLVLLDSDCVVVGRLDPFDMKQPNRMVPPLEALAGKLPFVLERPSASDNLPFEPGDLAEQERRARAFMALVSSGGWGGVGGLGGGDLDPCGPEAFTTTCIYVSVSFATHYQGTGWPGLVYPSDFQHMDKDGDDCGRGF